MAFPDEPQGAETPSSETAPHLYDDLPPHQGEHSPGLSGEVLTGPPSSFSDDWSSSGHNESAVSLTPSAPPITPPSYSPPEPEPSIFGGMLGGLLGGKGAPPKPPGSDDDDEDDEEGMSRMSFLE